MASSASLWGWILPGRHEDDFCRQIFGRIEFLGNAACGRCRRDSDPLWPGSERPHIMRGRDCSNDAQVTVACFEGAMIVVRSRMVDWGVSEQYWSQMRLSFESREVTCQEEGVQAKAEESNNCRISVDLAEQINSTRISTMRAFYSNARGVCHRYSY